MNLQSLGSVLSMIGRLKALDSYMTPGLVKGNAPAPGRRGKFKANQRKERKAGEKRRTIEAHRNARKKMS